MALANARAALEGMDHRYILPIIPRFAWNRVLRSELLAGGCSDPVEASSVQEVAPAVVAIKSINTETQTPLPKTD